MKININKLLTRKVEEVEKMLDMNKDSQEHFTSSAYEQRLKAKTLEQERDFDKILNEAIGDIEALEREAKK